MKIEWRYSSEPSLGSTSKIFVVAVKNYAKAVITVSYSSPILPYLCALFQIFW